MKSEKLMEYIGQIENSIIAEAHTTVIPPRKARFGITKRMSLIAASIALVLTLSFAIVYFLYPHTETETPLTGKTFASIDDIPITRIGINYQAGCNGHGPGEVFTTGGKFYFSMVTRWIGNDTTLETVNYYTLFRYDPESGSSTAISNEVGYIHLINGRFIYDRSGASLTAKNRWNYSYYSNNAEWNDEQKISAGDAKELLNSIKGTAAVEKIGNEIKVTMKDDDTEYMIKPDSLVIESRFNIIGVIDNKIFFYGSEDQNALYSMELTSSKPSPIMLQNEPVSGFGAFIGDDGMIYAHNKRDSASTLIKVDPVSNNVVAIAEVDARVWEYVVSGKYAVCNIAGHSPAEPSTIKALKLN
ncbi:MAG: hypothetical protein ACM3MK_05160 [Chitinophagales bacterium]